jgi:RNA polymerase sigma-70 factor (ECF subfamily)
LLYGYVRSRGLGETDARDVVQDVFVALVRALPTFQLNRTRGRFRTWLWQITHNAVVDHVRRRSRRDRAEKGWLDHYPDLAITDNAEADWEAAHRKRVLEYVLLQVRSQVQPKTWACFEHHVLHGLPSAKVGQQLDLSANAVCVNASRVLAKVREQCAAYEEDLGHAAALPGRG